MTEDRDHLELSERLPALLDGTLPSEDAADVEAHIAACDECRAELRGLELLRSGQSEALSATERGTLERGVMAGIAGEPEEATVTPLEPRRRAAARVAGVLGAAAVVVALGTFMYLGSSGGDDESALGGADTAQVENEEGAVEDRRAAEDADRKANGGGGAAAQGEAGTEAASDAAAATTALKAPTPKFRVEDEPLTAADLQKRGESSLESVTFAASYSADDADRDGSRTLLEQLVEAADEAAGNTVGDQVEECAEQVLDTRDPTIPTFGSVGELDGQEVLVLGFAWSRTSSGPLDRYMVWAWERGSCDVAVDFVDGKIETAN